MLTAHSNLNSQTSSTASTHANPKLRRFCYPHPSYSPTIGKKVSVAQTTLPNQRTGTSANRSTAVRPKLELMWLRFQDVAPFQPETYPDGVAKSFQIVADRIGGHVKMNFEMGIKDILDYAAEHPGE